jgi:hypothetical protein
MDEIQALYFRHVQQEARVEHIKSSDASAVLLPSAEAYLAKLAAQIEHHPRRLPLKDELEAKLQLIAAQLDQEQGSKGLCFTCENYVKKEDLPDLDAIACERISPPLRFRDEPLVICPQYVKGDWVAQAAFKVLETVSSDTAGALKSLQQKYRSELEKTDSARRF